ncbi:MAG: hypothetical protein WA705_01090 [Candidatus Ozemobacteraceae bacterium]
MKCLKLRGLSIGGCFLFVLLFPGWLSGCESLPHEWFLVNSEVTAAGSNTYAFADVLLKWHDKMTGELASVGLSTAPITIVGLFGRDPAQPINDQEKKCFEDAVSCAWPASFGSMGLKPGVILDDHDSLVKIASGATTPLIAIVQIKDNQLENIQFTDQACYLWAGIRFLHKEYALIGVKVITKNGDTVFLDEFEASPTVLADLIISPVGSFIQRLEKRNRKPMAIFFDCIASGAHGLLVQEDFPPENGLPPFSALQLPQQGLPLFSGPRFVPLGNATSTMEK